MSLILKQETANSVPTPSAGKGTIYINDSNVLAIKLSSGSTSYFPTGTSSNTQVIFNDNDALNGNSNFTWNKTTNTLSATNVNSTIVSASGNITGAYFIGNGSQLTGLPASYSNANVATYLASGTDSSNIVTTANVSGGNVLTSGLVSATGNVTGGNVLTAGLVSATSTITSAANITGSNLLTGGLVSAAGNITGNYIIGNGSQLTGLPAGYANADVATYLASGTDSSNIVTTANVSGGNIVTSGIVSAASTGYFGAGLSVTGNITATGNLNYQNVTDLVVGDPLIYIGANNTSDLVDLGMVASANVSGTYQHLGIVRDHNTGIWRFFSNVVAEPTTVIDWANSVYAPMSAGAITSNSTISASGNITGGNVVTGGLISATGNIITGANIVVGSGTGGNLTGANVISGTTLSATANITGGNLLTGGLISATSTITSAANITGGNILTGGLISATGNITGGNLVVASGSGGNLTGANVISANTFTASANITGGNLLTGGLISATSTITSAANITGGNILTGGIVSSTGNVVGGNIITSGYVSVTSVVTAIGNIAGGNLLTGGLVSATSTITSAANITGGNILTGGLISATGTITSTANIFGSYFIGNGSQLTGISSSSSAAGSNTQVQFNDGGVFGASANLTFDKATNTLNATTVTANGAPLATTGKAIAMAIVFGF